MKAYGKYLSHVFNTTWDGASPWPDLEYILGEGVKRGGAWLDIACGTGDLLARAHQAGFECAGADLSRAQLRYARETCPDAKFVQGPMQTVRVPGKFDVITCLGDSIHHLQNRRELSQFFRNVKRHLKSDGAFVFDFNTFTRTLDQEAFYTGGAWTYRNPGEFVCVEFEFDESTRLSEWTTTGFIKEGKLHRKFEEKHTLRAHTVEEVDELLGSLGFRVRKFDMHTRTKRPRKSSVALYFRCVFA